MNGFLLRLRLFLIEMTNDEMFMHLLTTAVVILSLGLICSCGSSSKIPVNQRDTLVVNYIDSVRVVERDSVILVPREVVKDYSSLLDTLTMETSLSKSTAFVDTTLMILKGTLENKQGTTEHIKVEYRDRIVYRDSLVVKEKEIPVEVEVVKYRRDTLFWILLGYAILSIVIVAIRLWK